MATHTIADDVLHSPAAEAYFTNADRRVMIGFRATLELLGLPLPLYALRRQPGPAPARSVAAAFRADHPKQFSTELRPRKPDASPERVADAQSRTAAIMAGSR